MKTKIATKANKELPVQKAKKLKFSPEEEQNLRRKQKAENKIRTYVVGLALIHFRQNVLIRVKANNDYFALLEAMKKFTILQASEYPQKEEWIKDSWESEEKLLRDKCKTFDDLLNYFCNIGFIVTKPLIVADDSYDLDKRNKL